jgi:hypothetical protein
MKTIKEYINEKLILKRSLKHNGDSALWDLYKTIGTPPSKKVKDWWINNADKKLPDLMRYVNKNNIYNHPFKELTINCSQFIVYFDAKSTHIGALFYSTPGPVILNKYPETKLCIAFVGFDKMYANLHDDIFGSTENYVKFVHQFADDHGLEIFEDTTDDEIILCLTGDKD